LNVKFNLFKLCNELFSFFLFLSPRMGNIKLSTRDDNKLCNTKFMLPIVTLSHPSWGHLLCCFNLVHGAFKKYFSPINGTLLLPFYTHIHPLRNNKGEDAYFISMLVQTFLMYLSSGTCKFPNRKRIMFAV